MMNETELERLRARLRESRLSARQVAAESGLGVEWVQKFRSGTIRNPGVLTVGVLFRYFDDLDAAADKSPTAPESPVPGLK